MNIKQLMVTFFIALLAGGEIGARVLTDKFVYSQGEKVVFTFDGKSEGKTIILKYLSKKGEPVLAEIGGEPFVWEVPSEFTPAAVGAKLDDVKEQIKSEIMQKKQQEAYVGVYQKEEGQLTYSSYFRVVIPGMLTTYQIAKEEYKGLNVFMLDGGMSAEYAVQKSLANLTAGVSHTWQIGPGGGPKPVWGTPDFLQQSVQHTVDLYNEYLGKSKKLKTVIIATGVPTVPYLSAAMEAPVLPLHFLVSVNSTKEVSSILEYSSQAGVPCYATLGYDASMDDVGVAWIKLLALPDEYRKFIIEHEVENVIIAGIGEDVKSESYCRKLSKTGVDGQEYADGSLYILYTQSGSEHDIKTISRNVVDYDTLSLEKGKDLADWESGVVNRQIDNISKGICEHTPAQVYSLIATHDMMDMYNLGANMGMYFMYKNREQTKVSVQGTYLNEYLISQPLYELTQGYIPLLFWQFVPPVSTIDRIKRDIQKVVDVYEKGILLENKTVHVNARIGKEELVQELKKRGFRFVTKRKDKVEELWNLSDGINSPCEEVVQNIVEQIGVRRYKELCENALYLDLDDLKQLVEDVQGLIFQSL